MPLTLDPDELIAARPDVVIHLARDLGNFASDDDLVRLLESGLNVITALPYTNLAFRGAEVRDRFQAAALAGARRSWSAASTPTTPGSARW